MPHDLRLWCEDCQTGYDGDCVEHGPLTQVADTEVSTRARRSIPHVLELKEQPQQIGVFAKETLSKRLQFGPLQAERIVLKSQKEQKVKKILESFKIVYKVLGGEQEEILLDTCLEESSNWMIFVRPAETKAEQNLVAYQYRGDIYFATIKKIPAQCELKIWFSKDYAERMGQRILAEEGVSWQVRTRQRFRCRGCEVVFSSTASLTNHRCSRTSQTPKGEASTPRSRRGRGKKGGAHRQGLSEIDPPTPSSSSTCVESATETGVSTYQPIPSTSSGAKTSKSDTQEIQRRQVITTVKEELGSPASSTESEETDVFIPVNPITPERRTSPRTSPRGRGAAYVCDICQKVFHSPGKLKQHSYSHTGERPFSCTHCTKAFSSRFKLERHKLIHTTERQHQCPLCERSFHRKDHLKNHIQIHDPNKQFKCEKPECGKEYNSYMSYRKHCAVHAAEEGDLECKICQKMFESKPDLIYHLKVHVGSRSVKSPSEKKFQCDHCDRRFFTRKDVKRHLVVHTGKRDFSCTICPQKFGRKDHLVRHIKKSHGVADVSRLEALEAGMVAVPGSSGTHPTAGLSPEIRLTSPSPSTSSAQPHHHLQPPMVLIHDPIPGTSGLAIHHSVAGPSNLPVAATDTTTYMPPAFQQEFRLFENIKEDPDLLEGFGSGGDDLSKMLGMYLPSGSINIPTASLLEPPPASATRAESELGPLIIRMSETAEHKSTIGSGSIINPLGGSPHLSRSQGGGCRMDEEALMSGQIMAAAGPSRLLPGPSLGPGTSRIPVTAVSSADEHIPAVGTPTTTTSATPPPSTTSATTTTTSLLPQLPGFDQAFP